MEEKLSAFKTPKERVVFLENKLHISLSEIKKHSFSQGEKVLCENVIGATTLPLGIIGPIKIMGDTIKSEYYVPLATTEGALIASLSRGSKATVLSGGITTGVELVGTTRGPVFEVKSLSEALVFKKWLKQNIPILQKQAALTSNHLKLLKIRVRIVGLYIYVRFYFDTDEAMGMNMATIATDALVQYIKKETNKVCIALSGNFCIDKKPAWLNFISGRGRRVWAQSIIKKSVIKQVLKTTAQNIFEVWMAKCMIGSIMSGSLGFNAHFANIVAAFFSSTGQDLAHVVEGSMGITYVKILKNEDLYFSVYLPSVMLGLVGGGTSLKVKKEALSIMKVKHTDELAQVLGATVLAGELSLLASLSEGTLAKTHIRLGR